MNINDIQESPSPIIVHHPKSKQNYQPENVNAAKWLRKKTQKSKKKTEKYEDKDEIL